jgi:hypothetical protein
MDMLHRLLHIYGNNAPAETRAAWKREYDALWEESDRLGKRRLWNITNGILK